MKVLTVYAHHNPRSFCHAVLERFDAGLREAGHLNEIVDLHAIGFDPVLRDRDGPNWIDDSVPDDVLARMEVPRSLKGWIERVFTLGFAFGLTADGWRGDLDGRLPLLHHRKALVINTTIFDQRSYAGGLGDAMALLIDEFALHFPGIRDVRHEYFYAVHGADAATLEGYLARAQALGRAFADGAAHLPPGDAR